MKRYIRIAAAALVAAMSVAPSASAASFHTRRVSVSTIIEFGNAVQPVVVDQNSPINIARTIQIGGTGTVDATIIQNGTRNYASVIQVGGTTNALIGQSGVTNTAYVRQLGGSTNALIAQLGALNTGFVLQFGRTNRSGIFQFSR